MTDTTSAPWTIPVLKGYIDSWSKEAALSFHGAESQRQGHEGKEDYIWEEANFGEYTGFVHYGPGVAAYYRNDGAEYLLTSEKLIVEDMDVHRHANAELYNLAASEGAINVSKLSNIGLSRYKSLTLDGTDYVYCLINHLGGELGVPLALYCTADLLDTFVDQIATMMKYLKNLNDSETITSYPSSKFALLTRNSNGLYWRYLHNWNRSKEDFYHQQVGDLQKYIQHLEKNNITVPQDTVTKAREKWATILSI